MSTATAESLSQLESAPAAESAPDSPVMPQANPNRSLEIEIEGERWLRAPVKTHVLTRDDDIVEAVAKYAAPQAKPGDWLTISEKVVAATQGRAIPESEMRIGWLAKILWRFVTKSPYGVGLRRPSSMQCAINECGAPRIVLAAVVGALGKLVGRSGDFYRVAGMQAATIDAAGTSPLQPDCVIMGPKDPEGVARRVREQTGIECAIMDINDIGGSWCLGASAGVDSATIERVMKDNPCGQGTERTPMALVRRVPDRGAAE